jgi:uncharacterized protein YecE (DUF72 family)
VVADRAGEAWLRHEVLTADFTYVRFHAGWEGGNGNYSHPELDRWAAAMKRWGRVDDVYAYFNNDWQGFAVENARYLRAALGQSQAAAAA